MKLKIIRIAVLVSILHFLLVSCNSKTREVIFPKTEIVYQVNGLDKQGVGFVNSDGSNNEIVSLDFDLNLPIWSNDGKILVFIDPPGDFNPDYPGKISVWKEGEGISRCKKQAWNAVSYIDAYIPDTTTILVVTGDNNIELFDYIQCKEIRRILDHSSNREKVIIGAAFAPNHDSVVFAETDYQDTPKLQIMNIDTGNISTFGEGRNPSWSPDGKWVSFIRLDGIYILSIENNNVSKLVSYDFSWYEYSHYVETLPIPRWDPSSTLLIYHKCKTSGENCSNSEEFAVYKVNVNTGKEMLVIDGGQYPYWRDQ